MPKLGMEPKRRASLVQATIAELGAAQTLDVTVSQIAKRAGMSSALAHHYFGGKDDIFIAAMRQILKDLQQDMRACMETATTPMARLHGIIRGSFAPSSFSAETINAWMLFYAMARTHEDAHRLLRIYQGRLRTHLRVALRPLSARPEADADTLAALIDGLYLRAASGRTSSPEEVCAHALCVAEALVGRGK